MRYKGLLLLSVSFSTRLWNLAARGFFFFNPAKKVRLGNNVGFLVPNMFDMSEVRASKGHVFLLRRHNIKSKQGRDRCRSVAT